MEEQELEQKEVLDDVENVVQEVPHVVTRVSSERGNREEFEKLCSETRKKEVEEREKNVIHWYVVRTHSRSAKNLREEFEQRNVEWFQASQIVVKVVKGKKQKTLKYFMEDIFFLHSSRNAINDLRKEIAIVFNFYYDQCKGREGNYTIIDDVQMRNFMRVANQYDAAPNVIGLDEIKLKKGDRIRIIGGSLDGVEGKFMQVSRGQKRKLVVVLDGIMAITAQVEPDMVEVIKDED